MIRFFSIVLIILSITTISFGQFLARDSVASATARARLIRADNQLVAIMSASSFQPTTGRATIWEYLFYSPTRTGLTGVFPGFPGGALVDTTITGFPPALLATIPTGFINSDSASAVAESHGGATYRQQHSNSTVQLTGGKLGLYTADTSRLVWRALYHSSSSGDIPFYIDMITGAYLGSTNSVKGFFSEVPNNISLAQNYPNPFNPTTSISFSLPAAMDIRLTVTDISGREVATLASGHYPTGNHSVSFDGKLLSSGSYFYKLNANGKVQVKQMELVK